MKHLIVLKGCDDDTYCELELSDKELEFLIKISKEINKHSGYACQPKISIYKDYKKTYDYDLEATDLVGSDKE